jgi:23S rRNA pseudouridine955/2504/2580 synthase
MHEPPAADLEVPADRTGQRLDNFLLGALRDLPRALVYRLLRRGAIRVDGRRARPADRLSGGERISLPPLLRDGPSEPATRVPAALAERLRSATLFENADFLVLDKPAGVASHAGSGIRVGVIEALRTLRGEPGLSLAHRLDRETSGILVLARNRPALLALHRALGARAVEKRYLALLAGRLPRPRLVAESALLRGAGGRVRSDAEGRAARSVFERLEQYREAAFAAVTIATGRTHQIRAHAASLGHPVLGDPRYGDFALNRQFERRYGLTRMFLHASYLSFAWGDRSLEFSAPLPPDLAAVLERLAR